ncbi:Smr/MutS family protein [Aquicella lusitana]|uniref:DNA-nicking Smr family endonuclease n=1 Tax=Aquicella lusitana TaxID=254246 RepID=A0A370GU10_9COXI|nr:Smr/MutS family protein [Aquicella lusitana]RDI46034.1 DNA-nicking Smr family endonuclease [Aquicella lusitana]VVC73369.1 putative DNA endonuclease SmrA [Aquicella lusitana]
MSKKSKISQEDIDAFLQAMKGTKPLTQNKIRLVSSPPKRTIRLPAAEDEPLIIRESQALAAVEGEDFIGYKHPSISNKMLRKLRKGQYNVEAILDLHGMSIEEAKIATDRFLQQCLHEGIRVGLIIHGKGRHSQTPILKNKLNHWLRELDVVLAFCSAAPSHGSRGAIYILLKRTR